jgi:hypothetical protein
MDDLSRREALKLGVPVALGIGNIMYEANNVGQKLLEAEKHLRGQPYSSRVEAKQAINLLDKFKENENKSKLSVYLGNVNSYQFPTISYTTPIEDLSKDNTDPYLFEDLEDEEYSDILLNSSKDIVFPDLQGSPHSNAVLNREMYDKIEIPLLLEDRLDIDLIYLDSENINLEKVEGITSELLETDIPDYIDLELETIDRSNGDPEKIFREVQEEYNERNSSALQAFITEEDIGVAGYAYPDADVAAVSVSDYKDNWPFNIESLEQIAAQILVHEAYHSIFDLPHSAGRDDIMSYNLENEGKTLGKRSSMLAERYLNSEFNPELLLTTEGELLKMHFQPAQISAEEARKEFVQHLETYIVDFLDFEDFSNWEKEYSREGEYDHVLATRTFKQVDEDLEMDIYVDYGIEEMSLR